MIDRSVLCDKMERILAKRYIKEGTNVKMDYGNGCGDKRKCSLE